MTLWISQFKHDRKVIVAGVCKLDMHSSTIEDSELTAFGHSLQAQLGLGFPQLFSNHRFDIIISEDILVGSAPDISFGMRLSGSYMKQVNHPRITTPFFNTHGRFSP